jgi:hypothetical protein
MAQKQVISYPISAYQNPPINPQYYQPSVFNISAISMGQNTTVTTSVNHNYVVGQLIRLLIPQAYGSYQLNEQSGFVTSVPAVNQVVVNILSNNASPFINAGTNTPAQIVAVGDVNTGAQNANGPSHYSTILPGSFIDISPL